MRNLIRFLIFILVFTCLKSKAQIFIIENKGKKYIDTLSIINYKAIKFFSKNLTKKERALLVKNKVNFYSNVEIKDSTLTTGINIVGDYRNDYVKNFHKGFINYPIYRRKGYTGKGVKVAVLDTGVDSLLLPYHSIQNLTASPSIYGGHGTAIGSVINSVIGLANGSEMHYLKIFSTDASGTAITSATTSQLQALQYCIDFNIKIIAISSSWFPSPLIDTMFKILYNNDAVIFASSGNSSTVTNILYPAISTYVYAVNAYSVERDAVGVDKYPFKNILGGKGISFALGGYPNEYVRTLNNYSGDAELNTNSWGTSISSCFMAAIFALKKKSWD